jgi:hypothetical protein
MSTNSYTKRKWNKSATNIKLDTIDHTSPEGVNVAATNIKRDMTDDTSPEVVNVAATNIKTFYDKKKRKLDALPPEDSNATDDVDFPTYNTPPSSPSSDLPTLPLHVTTNNTTVTKKSITYYSIPAVVVSDHQDIIDMSNVSEDTIDMSKDSEDVVDMSKDVEDIVDMSKDSEDIVDMSKDVEDIVDTPNVSEGIVDTPNVSEGIVDFKDSDDIVDTPNDEFDKTAYDSIVAEIKVFTDTLPSPARLVAVARQELYDEMFKLGILDLSVMTRRLSSVRNLLNIS